MLIAIAIYGILIGVYIYMKPSLSFRNNGEPRTFGIRKGQTLFPVWIIAIMIAVFVGFVFHLLNGSAEVIELRLIE
jgi:uncharacterized integral membrane protein